MKARTPPRLIRLLDAIAHQAEGKDLAQAETLYHERAGSIRRRHASALLDQLAGSLVVDSSKSFLFLPRAERKDHPGHNRAVTFQLGNQLSPPEIIHLYPCNHRPWKKYWDDPGVGVLLPPEELTVAKAFLSASRYIEPPFECWKSHYFELAENGHSHLQELNREHLIPELRFRVEVTEFFSLEIRELLWSGRFHRGLLVAAFLLHHVCGLRDIASMVFRSILQLLVDHLLEAGTVRTADVSRIRQSLHAPFSTLSHTPEHRVWRLATHPLTSRLLLEPDCFRPVVKVLAPGGPQAIPPTWSRLGELRHPISEHTLNYLNIPIPCFFPLPVLADWNTGFLIRPSGADHDQAFALRDPNLSNRGPRNPNSASTGGLERGIPRCSVSANWGCIFPFTQIDSRASYSRVARTEPPESDRLTFAFRSILLHRQRSLSKSTYLQLRRSLRSGDWSYWESRIKEHYLKPCEALVLSEVGPPHLITLLAASPCIGTSVQMNMKLALACPEAFARNPIRELLKLRGAYNDPFETEEFRNFGIFREESAHGRQTWISADQSNSATAVCWAWGLVNTPAVEIFLRHPSEAIRASVADHAFNLTAEQWNALREDSAWRVRTLLALNPFLPPALLKSLHDDYHPVVRATAFWHATIRGVERGGTGLPAFPPESDASTTVPSALDVHSNRPARRSKGAVEPVTGS